MKFVVFCACVALAVAQTSRPIPAPVAPFPGQPNVFTGFVPQPYASLPYYPVQYQPQPQPQPKEVTPAPVAIPKPKPAPQPQPIGIVAQQYQPYHQHHFIPIVRQNQDIQVNSGYQWDYQSANGITAYEIAQIVPINSEEASKSVQGGYSYTSPEGIPVEVTYTADENGFHPHVVVHTHGRHERRP